MQQVRYEDLETLMVLEIVQASVGRDKVVIRTDDGDFEIKGPKGSNLTRVKVIKSSSGIIESVTDHLDYEACSKTIIIETDVGNFEFEFSMPDILQKLRIVRIR